MNLKKRTFCQAPRVGSLGLPRTSGVVWFVAIFLACFGQRFLAQAQSVPLLVNYQGKLLNPDGSPVSTADYQLTFNVYDATTNGALIWGPQVFDGAPAAGHGPKIPVVQGYFNVMLGPVDITNRSLADAFSAPNRFVEITISNRPPIAPRQQILTTPFAFQAANSAKLAGYDWSAVFGTNDPLTGRILFGKLPQRQVGTNVGVGGIAVSPGSGLQSWMGPTTNGVTNIVVTLVTSGRPVFVGLVPDSPSSETSGLGIFSNGGLASADVIILQNGQPLARVTRALLAGSNESNYSLPSAITVAFPASGTWTYSIQLGIAYANIGTLLNVRLVAFEL